MLLIDMNIHNKEFSLYSDQCAWCFFNHDSTQGCLDTLYELGCENKDILDIGCGSGILEVYADKLGAKSISAIDVAPGPLGLTLINCQINNVKADLKFVTEPILSDSLYDLIVMNIEMHNAITYFAEIENHLKNGGKAIVTFRDRFNLENELHRAGSKLKIISENDLPNYRTFVLEVDE